MILWNRYLIYIKIYINHIKIANFDWTYEGQCKSIWNKTIMYHMKIRNWEFIIIVSLINFFNKNLNTNVLFFYTLCKYIKI